MEYKRHSIGILGMQRGVGVTHLCMAMTHYCAENLKEQTALVELSGHHEIDKMQKNQRSSLFHPDRRHFYANTRSVDMPEIISYDYGIYVIDAGDDYYRARQEFLRCTRKIVIASLAPWKRGELELFMSEVCGEGELTKDVTFLAQFGKKKDKKDFQKEYRLPIYTYPYIADPFQLTESDTGFIRSLL